MDDEEVDLSSHLLVSNPGSPNSFEDFWQNTRTCTHTHTCNPPGPSAAHTHTCYHTHTQVLSTGDEEQEEGGGDESKKPRKLSLGNREAVRKYREKKKAHAAYLEEEVKNLRVMNQKLMRRLQGQDALEAEVVRLRRLLVDLRAKIDGELGAFPYQKPCNGGGTLLCTGNAQRSGGNPEMPGWEGGCTPAYVGCQIDQGSYVLCDLDAVDGLNPMDTVRSMVTSASQEE